LGSGIRAPRNRDQRGGIRGRTAWMRDQRKGIGEQRIRGYRSGISIRSHGIRISRDESFLWW